jgi:hypothetical protein
MTAVDTDLVTEFVAQATADAEHGFRVLRQTGTLSANGTVAAAERIPGTERYVVLRSPGPWALDPAVEPRVLDLDGGDDFGFGRLLERRPELSTVVHVHSPYLGAWSQTHRDLPIRYVPVQRWTLGSVIPAYTDRTQAQIDFILERLEEDPHTPAILEANGGATVWGKDGVLPTLEYVQLVEEGAQFQILAEYLGGSKPVGAGVLEQQWRMSGLFKQAQAEGKLP